ncbi:MAG TPA: CarD family transcriptional regulator [Gaiellaceae bacterium]|nr:CarD family transcriptional regulator [Gaiellaceae bacterium]
MELGVGDLVVYGTHGIGRVAAREQKVVLGTKQEVIVLELEDGLTITLPLARAQEQLRPLVGKADLRRIREALRQDRELSSDPWLSRRRDLLAKLSGGDPVELAEIVGDGARRERERRAKGSKPTLSAGEREVFMKARKLLSEEIARARGISPEEADAWIEEQLARDEG